MSTTENKKAAEPVDKQALRAQINELERKLDFLYTLSDEVNRGILDSKDALERLREKRTKLLRARLDRIFAQWNIGSLTSNHHPSTQDQSQNPGATSTQGETQARNNQLGPFGSW
ncbi:hypothetical protein FBEOM_5522 [Fusarium beomiforme]|uniref:Uncharacterized protein n=1 Tax=Fusarium beomiforme TaxID=44412 RepID=A0A9P5AMK4_9HYPO|nr:hypothetical protein FBEOM_5522 [Fusarium beomiforme]